LRLSRSQTKKPPKGGFIKPDKRYNGNVRRGFTLIELLIVFGVIASLSAVVVVVLDPAEILRQTRDSKRMNDIQTINSAISLYLASGADDWVPISSSSICTAGTIMPDGTACTTNASTAVNGSGWIPINFQSIRIGSPLSRLPLDPINSTDSGVCDYGPSTGCFYVFQAGSTFGTYKIYANFESQKFAAREQSDGGPSAHWFETGASLDLPYESSSSSPLPPGDTISPTVSVTAPASGATVSSTVTVSASASDNVGVAGVQFKLDGANLGTEDTASPYSIS